MSFNIENFRANGLQQGGARPNQFEVAVFPPFTTVQSKRSVLLVSAASLPGYVVQPVVVPYFGAQIKYSGERVYDNWDVTVLNDEDFSMRAMFERWSNIMNTLISNRLDPGFYPTGYKTHAEVTQKGKDGRDLRNYRFVGLWPMSITPIPLDWGSQGQIEQFNVTFCLDYFELVNQSSATDQYNALLNDEPDQGSISGNPSTGTFVQ